MIETSSQQDTKALSTKIASLYHYFLDNGDVETADKTKQLLLKLHNHEYAVAFCGHFSAGKSSMINKIIGENLLPSSPIPTSANLVKIKTGEEYARVNFKEGKPRVYPAPYNYEKVKTYCKDGDSIQSIEISHASDKLPNDVCILDTPGIDSTDDAHRVATESALHLADLVFYVMDYNHVQSEVNFLFTKELTESGKDVYLVINQIDKHRDEELSFDAFKKSVKESFGTWGVIPAETFFTSLKEDELAHNEFSRLNQFIHTKLELRGSLLPQSISHSLTKLTEEHLLFLKEKDREALTGFEEQLAIIPTSEQPILPNKMEKINSELSKIDTYVNEKEKEFDRGIDTILKNAYLMPFESRELAERYLQATDPDFKVGLFFAKQKTEQEKKERLEKFFSDYQEKVTSQITWHIKEFLIRTLNKNEIHDSTLLSEVQSFSVTTTKEMLEGAVKPGARISGDYVLNYTADVAEMAKRIAKQQVNKLKEVYLEIVRNALKLKMSHLEREKAQLTILLEAWQNKQDILENHTGSQIHMEQVLTGHGQQGSFERTIDQFTSEKEDVDIVVETELGQESINNNIPEKVEVTKSQPIIRTEENQDRVGPVVRRLNYSADELHQIPGFKKISNLLKGKAVRLDKRGFTVALFGAFSAGKSSFANSLIGEKLLPVSPNPTTAAINKIMPIDHENTHGLVKVHLKREDVLFEDVNRSLAVFEMQAEDFDQALSFIEKVVDGTSRFDAHEKTHFSFLTAFSKGFEAYRSKLGETLYTDINEFKDFVANEEKSCLVELIEVHYDCALTRQGITLVDTPGADSINARHTGVAFEYIKNSDAILFVTYYNHAFSKADREFLIQLGRVKDTFEMDKMFFIVNAVDLANNEEEKKEVLGYVQEQLVQYGIRNPSLFPISSLLAIKEKQEKTNEYQSGINRFEESFYNFISHDLTDIAIKAALMEWERALEQLKSFIYSANEDNELRQEKVLSLKEEQKKLQEIVQNQSSSVLSKRLGQEVDELTYYIKQRVFFRFNDFFKEAFNPSVLRDDGRNLKKALHHALEDFLEDFGFDFAQEFRATTLRVESFMAKLIEETHRTILKELATLNPELSFSQIQINKQESLDFENRLSALDRDLFKKVLSLFKNPKSFFEKNEKRLMQEALNDILQIPVDTYLEAEKEKLLSFYQGQLEQEFAVLVERILDDAGEYYEGMYATLSNEISVEQLEKLEHELENFG